MSGAALRPAAVDAFLRLRWFDTTDLLDGGAARCKVLDKRFYEEYEQTRGRGSVRQAGRTSGSGGAVTEADWIATNFALYYLSPHLDLMERFPWWRTTTRLGKSGRLLPTKSVLVECEGAVLDLGMSRSAAESLVAIAAGKDAFRSDSLVGSVYWQSVAELVSPGAERLLVEDVEYVAMHARSAFGCLFFLTSTEIILFLDAPHLRIDLNPSRIPLTDVTDTRDLVAVDGGDRGLYVAWRVDETESKYVTVAFENADVAAESRAAVRRSLEATHER